MDETLPPAARASGPAASPGGADGAGEIARTRGRLVWPSSLLTAGDAQRGVYARPQLIDAFGEAVVDDLARAGTLERLERGVYRVVGGVRLPEQAAFAAALRARPKATITGPLVLHLLGIPGLDGEAPFEILVPPERRLSGVGFPFRVDPDPSRPVIVRGAVRTVGPLDALIDSAVHAERLGGERAIRVAWDHLRWQLDQRADRLERRLDALRGAAPGVERLESILEVGGGVLPESEGERRLAPFGSCFEPAFVAQERVTIRRRSDLFERRTRTALEYLGEVDHAHLAARIADDERDGELREADAHVLYVTAADLREPEVLLGRIASTLTVRAHQRGVTPPAMVRPLRLP
ncbi:hypothetical protein FTX61_06555 [Nitriliruptoraceae bacterium ZYF776]|nr:hypothetical protein [Profundirhabdus halotolerans]